MLREMASLNLDFSKDWEKWGLWGKPVRYEDGSGGKWMHLQRIFHWLRSPEGREAFSGCLPAQLADRIIREKDYAKAALRNDGAEEFAKCYRLGWVRGSFSSLVTTAMYEGAVECCRFMLREMESIDVDDDWTESTMWQAIYSSRGDWNRRTQRRCLDVVVAMLMDSRFRKFAGTNRTMHTLASNCARNCRYDLADSIVRYARAEGIKI